MNRQLSATPGVGLHKLDYSSDHESDMEDPEDLRLTLSPSALSGDMITLNGDLADDIVLTHDTTPPNESCTERMTNGTISSNPTNKDVNCPHLNGNVKQLNIGCSFDYKDTSSDCSARFRKYSSSSNGDHNHIRDDIVSSPLRRRSSSSECSEGGASNCSHHNCSCGREPIMRRTSHTLAEAFLEQLPEVRSRDVNQVDAI